MLVELHAYLFAVSLIAASITSTVKFSISVLLNSHSSSIELKEQSESCNRPNLKRQRGEPKKAIVNGYADFANLKFIVF